MRGMYAAPRGARGPIRFPVCFDVVACRRCVHRCCAFRLHRRHRGNRKAHAMRRKSTRGKRCSQTLAVVQGEIGRNVSGTHRYSAYDTVQRVIACARIDIATHAEQGWTAVSAPTSPLPSIERGGMHQRNVAKM
ncbi:hypothetical protein [Burkholderia lata]|uniref:hypothetical protein n=1 Tax=Burkholderia lata (strain ATCC 17760 / DSM 23089 / LMG 22485 / NCIMB 9086 / R18194 / 383) TaxID=482957 RepID=UPI00158442F5|nr:hypothetical protein [Burkholderia lata]